MRVFELEAMHQMFAVSRPGYAASFGLDRVVGRVGQSPRTSMQARWRSPLRTWSSTPSKVTASGTSSLQPTTGPQSTPVTKPESQPSGPQLVVCSPESGRGTGPLRPRRKPLGARPGGMATEPHSGFCLLGHHPNGSCRGSRVTNSIGRAATSSAKWVWKHRRGILPEVGVVGGFACIVASGGTAAAVCMYGGYAFAGAGIAQSF
jgi:hypothetical protein